jgi:hypothetical protein
MSRTAASVFGSGFGSPVRASIALLTLTVHAAKSTSVYVNASSSSGRA